MSDIIVTGSNIPNNIDDLAKFALIGREKLVAVRAEIRAIDKVGLAQEVREQKLHEAQEINDAVLDAEMRIGELMTKVPKAGNGGANQYQAKSTSVSKEQKTKADIIRDAGFTQKQVERFQQMAAHPEIVAQAKAEARENDDIASRADILKRIRAQKKADEIEQAKASIAEQQRETGKAMLYIGDGIGYVPDALLLTDPPYSIDVDNIDAFVDSWLWAALNGVRDDGFAYIFIGAYPDELRAYLNAYIPPHMKLEQVLVWTYKNTLGQNPKDRYKQNWQACLFYRGVNAPALDCPLTNEQWAVQEINAPDGRQGDRYHAWQKPMEIAERFIRHSTKPGAIVFDPFACTGTFLLAAAKLGRVGYGFEINPDNAAIAAERGCVLSTEAAF